MSQDIEVLEQKALPHFDEYYKHNDYIQNFELAAAMDTAQHRIFDTLMSCMQSLKQHNQNYLYSIENTNDKVIKLNLDFFMSRYKSSFNLSSIKRADLIKAVDSLNSIRILKEHEDGAVEAISVFPRVKADPKKGVITIKIDSEYKYDSLTPLNGNFTKLLHSKQVELKSVYARILYQYFISFLWKKNTHTKLFELTELQRVLGILDARGKIIKKTYAKVGEFKRRCLNDAITAINECTDIQLESEDIKTGREITGFKFFAKKGEKVFACENIDTEDNQLEYFRPNKKDFTDIKQFVKAVKQNYKERNLTNSIPGHNPENVLALNKNGYLVFLHNNKYKNLSANKTEDKNIAENLWKWLYNNMEVIGIFREISKLAIYKYDYINKKIEIDNTTYNIVDIIETDEYWEIIIDDNINKKSFSIKKTEVSIEDYMGKVII